MRKQPAMTAAHHNVYVVELDLQVMEDRRFQRANPGWDGSQPCLYVGSTGLTPRQRFTNHKDGHKANRYVRKFGQKLRPDLYGKYNPMTWMEAGRRESQLASDLRAGGYAVWQL